MLLGMLMVCLIGNVSQTNVLQTVCYGCVPIRYHICMTASAKVLQAAVPHYAGPVRLKGMYKP